MRFLMFKPGIYCASLTPLHADGTIDARALSLYCQELIRRGCSGVLLFGTTGEGTSFSSEEKIKALSEVIHQGLNPQKIVFGIEANAIQEAVLLSKYALKEACSSVLILPPFYYKEVSEEGVIAYFREIFQKVGPSLRAFLYHYPKLSGVPFTVKIVAKLVEEFPSIVLGLKDSEGNLNLIQALCHAHPHLKIFAANESELLEAMALGASGTMSGLANLYPEALLSLYEHAKDPHKPHQLETIQRALKALKPYPFIPAIKGLIQEIGPLRPPLMPLKKEDLAQLKETLL